MPRLFFDSSGQLSSGNSPLQLWQTIFDAMNTAVCIIDADRTILHTNKRWEALFNPQNNVLAGKICHEILHGSTTPHSDCPLQQARKSGKRESTEFEKNGRWFYVIVDPIFSAEGDFLGAIQILVDNTERKQLESSLQRSQKLLRNSARMTKTGGWEWDLITNKTYWTEEMFRLHGFSPDHFPPESPKLMEASLMCFLPEDRETLQHVFDTCAKTGEPYDYECLLTRATGERIWIRTAGEAIWENGRITKVIGLVSDITDSKLVRDKLASRSARLNKLFNAIDDAIFVHPFKQNRFAPFTEVNDVACHRYGYSHEEFLFLTAGDITAQINGNSHAQKQHRQQLLKQKQLIFETVHVKRSGETMPVEINSNIFYQDGKPYILAVVRDITERKKEEEKKEALISKLRDALDNIKTLRGLLPICTQCKKIRDDQGYWKNLESYLHEHSDASFSHGICPDCAEKLYGQESWYIEGKKQDGD